MLDSFYLGQHANRATTAVRQFLATAGGSPSCQGRTHWMIDDGFLLCGAAVDWRRLRSRCRLAAHVPMNFMEREVFFVLRSKSLCISYV